MAKIHRDQVVWRTQKTPDGVPAGRLPFAAVNNKRLSSDAKIALFHLINDNLKKIDINKGWLAQQIGISPKTMEKVMTELREQGYYEYWKDKDGWHWNVHPVPIDTPQKKRTP